MLDDELRAAVEQEGHGDVASRGAIEMRDQVREERVCASRDQAALRHPPPAFAGATGE
jgi:hypothetical protein